MTTTETTETEPCTRQVVVRMPQELIDALKGDAAANERTVAATIRLAARQYLQLP